MKLIWAMPTDRHQKKHLFQRINSRAGVPVYFSLCGIVTASEPSTTYSYQARTCVSCDRHSMLLGIHPTQILQEQQVAAIQAKAVIEAAEQLVLEDRPYVIMTSFLD